jgi:DNA-binding XRE family transcriptional regulator
MPWHTEVITATGKISKIAAMRTTSDERPKYQSLIARRFMRLRRTALLTQSRLGELIRLCRQSVNEIENRRVTPYRGTWARFRELERKHQQRAIVFPRHWF